MCSSSFDFLLSNLSHPSSYPYLLQPLFSAILTSITSWDSHILEDQLGKDLFEWLIDTDGLFDRQSFRHGRLTVDQIFLLSQSITDSFHQSKPGTHIALAIVDFAKAFDSVWHSALLSKLLSFALLLCFVD